MFSKAYLKLAGFYLAIITAISLFFSINIYFVSVRELERGARRQDQIIESTYGPPGPGDGRRIRESRNQNLEEAKARVVNRLILVNVLIIIAAGGLSYYLARRTLRPIEEAHDSLDRFTADASHELRTPITAMRSEIEVALDDPKLSLKQAKLQLVSNLEELEKLTNLSEGLLRLAQLDAAQLPTEQLELSDLVNQAIRQVSSRAKKKHINVKFQSTPSIVRADQASLVEAFVTVLDNAIKYSPKKSTVRIAISKSKHQARVAITDNGPGISPEQLPHIFDRFYRADSSRTKNVTDGHGLGLSLAKHILKLNRGSITADSKLDQGTTITIVLPV